MRTLSLMSFQIILVISSPSSSTTGFLTLIFLNAEAMLRRCPDCRCETVSVGACLETLDTAVREVDVSVFAEARRQRNAVLVFISREESTQPAKPVGIYFLGPRIVNRELPRSRSRLWSAGTAKVWCSGVSISAAKDYSPLDSVFAARERR
jgi:hypothetical protein